MSIRIDADAKHIGLAGAAARDFLGFAEKALADVLWDGLDAVRWNPERQWVEAIYTPPPGEAAYIAEAIARMVAVRSRRRDLETAKLRPAIGEWWPLAKLQFRPLFDGCGSREVGHGWIDLTLALADWVWTPDCTLRFDHFAERDDGALRIDMSGFDEEDYARVTGFELLSRHVCSTCGAPGKVYDADLMFAASVYCPAHAQGRG